MPRMKGPSFTCSVKTQYLPEQSQLPDGPFAFSYTVTIQNSGDVAAQLVARHWIVTDATGHVEEVRGLAVVGHQPLLKPGESFEYTSWTRLATPHGTMQRHLLLHDRGRACLRRADRRSSCWPRPARCIEPPGCAAATAAPGT